MWFYYDIYYCWILALLPLIYFSFFLLTLRNFALVILVIIGIERFDYNIGSTEMSLVFIGDKQASISLFSNLWVKGFNLCILILIGDKHVSDFADHMFSTKCLLRWW